MELVVTKEVGVKNLDFSHYLFRCSSLGYLMTEERGKSNLDKYNEARERQRKLEAEVVLLKEGSKSYLNKCESIAKACAIANELEKIKDQASLSETAKTHLMDVYISEKYGRNTDIENKYIRKGLMAEEDGITIYSRIKKTFFKKNETRLKNQYIMGTPDIFVGKSIHEADRVPDIKCSWNLYTFLRTFTKDINSIYYWQGIGYMWLTGAKYFDLAYTLVNTPKSLIEAEMKSLWYKLGQPAEDDVNFIDACKEIENSLTYDDIPLNEKLLEYTIERDETAIELLKSKVIAARVYLNELRDSLIEAFKPSGA